MDKIKIAVILFAFLFTVCTLLSVFSFLLVFTTAKQTELFTQSTEFFLQELSAKVVQQEDADKVPDAPVSEDPKEDGEVEADILYNTFTVREANGKIGVYTEEGYLIRTLQVDVQTLPAADRTALSKGIELYSWRELISLIQDYEG